MEIKKNSLIIVIILLFAQQGKCDTIDSWHVYYNKKKIGDFDQYSGSRMKGEREGNEIVINSMTVKDNDSLTVTYYRDTPCDDCPTVLMVEDKSHARVIVSKGKGTFKPIAFAVKDLIEVKNRTGDSLFMVYFSEEQGRYGIYNVALFRIVLE